MGKTRNKRIRREGLIPLKSNDSNNENEELNIWCCTHLEILHPKRLDFHEELAPGIVGDFIIEPKLILYHGRRYWKSVHGNGKFAIWNCGLKWIIGKAEDMPNCLSWAESDYDSKDLLCPNEVKEWTFWKRSGRDKKWRLIKEGLEVQCRRFVSGTNSITNSNLK